MWVQLRTIKHVEEHGKVKSKQPGDWVNVGKQQALRWLADLSAYIPAQKITELTSEDCGLYIRGKAPTDLELSESKLGITEGDGAELKYPKTLLWKPSLRLRGELVPVGFHLLTKWQLAVPLWDYKELACHIGTEEERERTEAVIRELRVPLYDTRLMFVKRCGDTRRLIDVWQAEEGDERLAFLRALYQVNPLILALPITWKGKME